MLLYLPPSFLRFSSRTRRPATFRLALLPSRGRTPRSTSSAVRVATLTIFETRRPVAPKAAPRRVFQIQHKFAFSFRIARLAMADELFASDCDDCDRGSLHLAARRIQRAAEVGQPHRPTTPKHSTRCLWRLRCDLRPLHLCVCVLTGPRGPTPGAARRDRLQSQRRGGAYARLLGLTRHA